LVCAVGQDIHLFRLLNSGAENTRHRIYRATTMPHRRVPVNNASHAQRCLRLPRVLYSVALLLLPPSAYLLPAAYRTVPRASRCRAALTAPCPHYLPKRPVGGVGGRDLPPTCPPISIPRHCHRVHLLANMCHRHSPRPHLPLPHTSPHSPPPPACWLPAVLACSWLCLCLHHPPPHHAPRCALPCLGLLHACRVPHAHRTHYLPPPNDILPNLLAAPPRPPPRRVPQPVDSVTARPRWATG